MTKQEHKSKILALDAAGLQTYIELYRNDPAAQAAVMELYPSMFKYACELVLSGKTSEEVFSGR